MQYMGVFFGVEWLGGSVCGGGGHRGGFGFFGCCVFNLPVLRRFTGPPGTLCSDYSSGDAALNVG